MLLLLSGGILILSGILKLTHPLYYENVLGVEMSVNWLTVPILLRLTAGIEFLIGVWFIFRLTKTFFIIPLMILLLLLYIVAMAASGNLKQSMLTTEVGLLNILGLLCIGFTFFMVMTQLKFDHPNYWVKWFFIPVLFIPFIATPMKGYNFTDAGRKAIQIERNTSILKKKSTMENIRAAVLVSPGCSHCQLLMERMKGWHGEHTLFVILGEEKEATSWAKSYAIDHYIALEVSDFVQITTETPTVLIIEDEKIQKEWVGKEVNYFTLKRLSALD